MRLTAHWMIRVFPLAALPFLGTCGGSSNSAPTPVAPSSWTRQLGTAGEDSANAIASDNAGNLYVAGTTTGALDGQTSAGGTDLFITSYRLDGTKRWTRQLGTTGLDVAHTITTDTAGNLYVAGFTAGALDGQTSVGGWDLFITSYTADGTKRWTRQLGTASEDRAYAITTDTAGNLYVTGYTADALDGQISAGGEDLFITSYRLDGTKRWTRQLGTTGSDFARAITTDTVGNLYVAGVTESALDGQTSAGGWDLFITSYTADGIKRWTRQLGTAFEDRAYAITTDTAGNLYVTGYTTGALDGQISAGGEDLFITSYRLDGTKRWTRQLGTTVWDSANAITRDNTGNLYVAGYTNGALDGQTSTGGTDLFITSYTGDGTKRWTRQLGTMGYDVARAITGDTFGNLYLAGYTEGALDGQTSAGGSDLFVMKRSSE